jgi:hypothetical protein
MAYCDFVAKCVYAYLAEHDDGSPEDRKFINELIRFLDGDSK